MSDPQEKSNIDQAIDSAAARLRNQVVPPVPDQLFECKSDADPKSLQRPINGLWVTWAIGIAAAVLVIVGFAYLMLPNESGLNGLVDRSSVDRRNDVVTVSEKIHVQALDEMRPFEELTKEIAEMKSEIERLKIEATSVDAIRRIDVMLATN